jgi:hypothetical protein
LIDLVLKWSPRLVPDTIERHIEVASEQGSVWWGRQCAEDSGVVGLGAEWLEKLRGQLAARKPTYVYLHSKPGGTWRAQLLGITTNKAEVNADLIPSYYGPTTHYNLWVNLTRFEKSDPVELIESYVLARTGASVTSKGLNNQTPLILQRRDGVASQGRVCGAPVLA